MRPLIYADFIGASILAIVPISAARVKRSLGMTLEQYSADRSMPHLPELIEACAPLERTLSEQPFVAGAAPAYVDYVVFSVFQWARVGSPRDVLAGGERDDRDAWLAGAHGGAV